MKNKHVIIVALIVYLLVSMIPQIGLMSLLGKTKGKGK